MLIGTEDQLRELFKNFAEVYSINIQSQIESAVEASLSNKNMTVKRMLIKELERLKLNSQLL